MTTSLSIELDPTLKAELEREANAEHRTAAWVATRAIESYLKAKNAKRIGIQEALVEADRGAFVSREAVDRWVRSWGSDVQEPAPHPDLDVGKE